MGINHWFRSKFLYTFREILLYHNESLEFRAKVFASIVSVDKKLDECELDILKDMAKKIYPDDEYRRDVLINTTKEYFKKVVEKNGLDVYELLMEIENVLKVHKRFYKKIDISQLKAIRDCKREDSEVYILQTRVIEFLISRKAECEANSIKLSKGYI